LDDIKWLKYLGGSVETGWFSSLLGGGEWWLQNTDLESMC